MKHLKDIDTFDKVNENESIEKTLDENSTLYNEEKKTITGSLSYY